MTDLLLRQAQESRAGAQGDNDYDVIGPDGPSGFVPPCLPTKAERPPSGEMWLHEIKHDGFRVIAPKDGANVRLYSRPGNDFTLWSCSWV